MCEEDSGIFGNDGITPQSQIYFGEKILPKVSSFCYVTIPCDCWVLLLISLGRRTENETVSK
jgi:hypothetical protein